MKSRKLKNRIAIHRYVSTDDTFGGETAEPGVKIDDTWCAIKSIPTSKLADYGLDQTKSAIVVRVRHRTDIDFNDNDLYLVYKGVDYTINRVAEKNLNGYHFDIIANT